MSSLPHIKYLVSSPYGDVSIDKNRWDLPLEGDELKTPYKIYFQSIKDFLARDKFKTLLGAASKKLSREINIKEVNEIVIRSEKHGAFYHPASIELITLDDRVKLGLNVAISDIGRYWIKKEYYILEKLNNKFNLPYLPEVYFIDEFNSMSFLLEDWFEGYHEFHISRDKADNQQLKLWDFDKGYIYLSPEESHEIYKQASKILTSYYDIEDFSQILAWHHAAGDFVSKIESKKIEVRLTTARQYEPFIGFADSNSLNPILALIYFFLDMTLKMRIDRFDGIGEMAWADDTCVEATITGFFEAMETKGDLKSCLNLNNVEEFLRIIRLFTKREIKTIINPLLEEYKKTNDYTLIKLNLDRHIEKLLTILENFL